MGGIRSQGKDSEQSQNTVKEPANQIRYSVHIHAFIGAKVLNEKYLIPGQHLLWLQDSNRNCPESFHSELHCNIHSDIKIFM